MTKRLLSLLLALVMVLSLTGVTAFAQEGTEASPDPAAAAVSEATAAPEDTATPPGKRGRSGGCG